MAETLYEMLPNPLEDQETLNGLIRGYTEKYSMYNGITRGNAKNKTSGRYTIKDRDDLYVFIFNEWKYILTELLKRNAITEKFKPLATVLVRYLQTLNPKTYQEVMDIMDEEEIKDEKLKEAMQHFGWNKIGEYSSWEHIHSNYVRYGTSKNQEIRHRLYINSDSTSTHRLALRFMQKCNERKLSYYFKFDDVGARDDTFVIYSDTKHLMPYITILRELAKEDSLRGKFHTPPVMTSKIDGWIGYGSEPEEEKTSFNEKRANHLEKCIKEESSAWMERNLNSKFRLNGKEITYQQYLIRGIVKAVVNHYKKYTGTGESVRKFRGYVKEDVTTPFFEELVRRYVIHYFPTIMEYYRGNTKSFKIEMPFKAGKIQIYRDMLEEARREQVSFIHKNSKRFQKDLLARIKRTAKEAGIDPENYACDEYILKELQDSPTTRVSKVNPTPNVSGTANYKPADNPRRGMIYQAMTEEEIAASRKKLGL